MKNKNIIIALTVFILIAGILFLFAHGAAKKPVITGSTSHDEAHCAMHAVMAPPEDKAGKITAKESMNELGKIEYWTCSMHPSVRSDGPGKCPICAMDLIPVHSDDIGRIVVDEPTRKTLGLISQPVEYRHLTKTIRLPGKTSHDHELYQLQQEYISLFTGFERLKDSDSFDVGKRQKALLDSANLRLRLLGLSPEQISELEHRQKPDESFIYPSEDKVWLLADVYEQDLGVIKSGHTAIIKLKKQAGELRGKVYSVEQVLNPRTRSAKARIEIENPGGLITHEVFAEVEIELDLERVLSVYRTSIIDTGTRKIAYLDLGEGRYEQVQVRTGVATRDFVEILEGLKEGDMVVTEGNFLLDSQATLTGGQALLYGAGEEVSKEPAKTGHRH